MWIAKTRLWLFVKIFTRPHEGWQDNQRQTHPRGPCDNKDGSGQGAGVVSFFPILAAQRKGNMKKKCSLKPVAAHLGGIAGQECQAGCKAEGAKAAPRRDHAG